MEMTLKITVFVFFIPQFSYLSSSSTCSVLSLLFIHLILLLLSFLLNFLSSSFYLILLKRLVLSISSPSLLLFPPSFTSTISFSRSRFLIPFFLLLPVHLFHLLNLLPPSPRSSPSSYIYFLFRTPAILYTQLSFLHEWDN